MARAKFVNRFNNYFLEFEIYDRMFADSKTPIGRIQVEIGLNKDKTKYILLGCRFLGSEK